MRAVQLGLVVTLPGALAIQGPTAAARGQRIDGACVHFAHSQQTGSTPGALVDLRSSFAELHCFGAAVLPLSDRAVGEAELEQYTGLAPKAFVPQDYYLRQRVPTRSVTPKRDGAYFSEPAMQFAESAAAAMLGLALLEVAAQGLRVNADDTLRALHNDYLAFIPISLGVCGGSVIAMSTVDSLLRSDVVRPVVRVLRGRGEAVVRHEAGHFLACVLLGVPVAAVHVDHSWRSLFGAGSEAGVTFHAPAMVALSRGTAGTSADVDSASVVLMAGIAAEALFCGSADGGHADQVALAELYAESRSALDGEHDGRVGESRAQAQAQLKQQARWAAANAVLLLKSQPAAFDALCAALRRGASVGECCIAIEDAFVMPEGAAA